MVKDLRILLVDNYDSCAWNLFQLIWKVAGVPPVVVRNDEATVDDLLARDFTHVVISPGPGTPAREADFGLCGDLLLRTTVPCLGVCLGHQGLAVAFGGEVGHAPDVVHGRTSAIAHTGSGVFAGLPQGFQAVRCNSLTATEPLPDDLVVTARAEDGVVMGLEHRERPLYGVQFHPESVESEYGEELIANFLGIPPTLRWSDLDTGLEAQELFLRAFADSPYSFWLDSSRAAYGMGRYSYLGSCAGPGLEVIRAYAATNVVEHETGDTIRPVPGTVFDELRAGLAATPVRPGACFPPCPRTSAAPPRPWAGLTGGSRTRVCRAPRTPGTRSGR